MQLEAKLCNPFRNKPELTFGRLQRTAEWSATATSPAASYMASERLKADIAVYEYTPYYPLAQIDGTWVLATGVGC